MYGSIYIRDGNTERDENGTAVMRKVELNNIGVTHTCSAMNTAARRGTTGSGHRHSDSDCDMIQTADEVEQNSQYESGTHTSNYQYEPPPAIEEKMRRELKFYFMNPYEKYKARGRKPWKLGVQLIKIVLVTLQLVQFGTSQFKQATFFEDNEKAFNNIFLKDWDPGYDSFAYPKTRQLYALYLKEDVFQHLNYAIYQYSQLENIAIGTYEFEVLNATEDIYSMTLCNKHFSSVEGKNGTFDVNLTTAVDCKQFEVSPTANISIKKVMKDKNISLNFDSLIELKLKFSIRSLHVKNLDMLTSPDCVRFNISIIYDYSIHGGRIGVKLSEDHSIFYCSNKVIGDYFDGVASDLVKVYDVLIMILCSLSLTLCLRSIHRGRKLKKKTMKFFKRYYSKNLTRIEKLEFLNFWYIMIILSDMCTIMGSIVKLLIEFKLNTTYDVCSLLLGSGCFFVWLGILRYLGFFPKYNIPIVTLKSALPNCGRFIVCGLILYMAYGFSGWIVLGPYHHKFRTLNVAIECMFSLINGDDMYATFDEMSDKSTVVWIYSRIYLYSFISLFIYAILSLFIALIMDTYETVKECHGRHKNHTDLEAFIDKCDDRPESGCYRRKKKKKRKLLKFVRNCCKRSSSSDEENLVQ
ncbi:mucolipin-3-like isoform X1 [Asterias amurensis]|uniref:mucolipin-3-like isoform X1 n=2 Tax=Asterias amurensis TaxID=7602 RepID=UPI003AB75C42